MTIKASSIIAHHTFLISIFFKQTIFLLIQLCSNTMTFQIKTHTLYFTTIMLAMPLSFKTQFFNITFFKTHLFSPQWLCSLQTTLESTIIFLGMNQWMMEDITSNLILISLSQFLTTLILTLQLHIQQKEPQYIIFHIGIWLI